MDDVENISDTIMEDSKKSDGDKYKLDVDNLTQKMSKTSISQKKVSFMGIISTNFFPTRFCHLLESSKSSTSKRLSNPTSFK